MVCSLQLILGNPSACLSDGHFDTSKLPLAPNTATAARKENEISGWFFDAMGYLCRTLKGAINQTGQIRLSATWTAPLASRNQQFKCHKLLAASNSLEKSQDRYVTGWRGPAEGRFTLSGWRVCAGGEPLAGP